ncbi:MAG: hypothetical protein KAU62_17370, partial [Candidatus Heimdallarchaeota archaeon]|nr:hypothetical protein [Candidatus Heimdallarchaeota archaeon]MCK4612930.1 hypothetical protein [Candidatus Heimdallarchaeota archaeon]
VAEKVEFWCLYGKTAGMFEEKESIIAKSSEEIITELEERKTKSSEDEIGEVIRKIIFLRRGLDFKTQKSLV